MRQTFRRVGFIPYYIWHARHEMYHILLGLVWAWFLREMWGSFNITWIWLSIFGSLLPDADHFLYFFLYGKKDWYSVQIKTFLRKKQWRNLWTFIESGHKYNTRLISHNYFFMGGFLLMSIFSFFYNWEVGVILFGAMVIHYVFDIVDDVFVLGHINPNWKHLGRVKEQQSN